MGYQWNPQKAQSNHRKHGVRFADAVTAFIDDRAIVIEDNESDEDRFAIIGSDAMGRVLVVVYTYRGDDIRIISARKATGAERRYYGGA
jgi:uncharacterized protein